MSQQPSGWYDDPSNPDLLRYWDGGDLDEPHRTEEVTDAASQSTIGRPQQQPPTAPLPKEGAAGPGSGQQGQESQQYPQQSQQYQQLPGAGQYGAPAAAAGLQGPAIEDGVPLASGASGSSRDPRRHHSSGSVVQLLTPIFVSRAQRARRQVHDRDRIQRPVCDERLRVLRRRRVGQGWAAVLGRCVGLRHRLRVTLAQTPGKMVLRISVRRTDRPGPLVVTAIKRRILPLVSIFIGLLTLIVAVAAVGQPASGLARQGGGTYVVVGKQPRRPM